MPLPTSPAQRLASRLTAVVCLLLFFYLALSTALAKTPTADEPAHIVRSFVVSQTGDLQFQLGHAPLSHRLIGALLFSEAELPQVTELPLWGTGDRLELAAQLLWDSDLNVDRLLFLTRLPIIWLGLLLGAMAGQLGVIVARELAHDRHAHPVFLLTKPYRAFRLGYDRSGDGGHLFCGRIYLVALLAAAAEEMVAGSGHLPRLGPGIKADRRFAAAGDVDRSPPIYWPWARLMAPFVSLACFAAPGLPCVVARLWPGSGAVCDLAVYAANAQLLEELVDRAQSYGFRPCVILLG